MPESYQLHGRSHFDAGRQKENLYKIGIWLLDTKKAEFNQDEFSTILIFNFLKSQLKNPLEMMLLGFDELDEFLGRDVEELYDMFARRYPNYKGRMIKQKG